jgi:endonuclease YncB( thermonuclease family)
MRDKLFPQDADYQAYASVQEVVDGDTLKGFINPLPGVIFMREPFYTWRLYGIDTAETHEEKGEEHTNFVKNWVNESYNQSDSNMPFVVKFDGERDVQGGFGRLLIDLYSIPKDEELFDALLNEYGKKVLYKE